MTVFFKFKYITFTRTGPAACMGTPSTNIHVYHAIISEMLRNLETTTNKWSAPFQRQ